MKCSEGSIKTYRNPHMQNPYVVTAFIRPITESTRIRQKIHISGRSESYVPAHFGAAKIEPA